jgi:hypothetical protein
MALTSWLDSLKTCVDLAETWGWILGRNWDFYSPRPPPLPQGKSGLKLVCNVQYIRKPQVRELSRLWPRNLNEIVQIWVLERPLKDTHTVRQGKGFLPYRTGLHTFSLYLSWMYTMLVILSRLNFTLGYDSWRSLRRNRLSFSKLIYSKNSVTWKRYREEGVEGWILGPFYCLNPLWCTHMHITQTLSFVLNYKTLIQKDTGPRLEEKPSILKPRLCTGKRLTQYIIMKCRNPLPPPTPTDTCLESWERELCG